MSIGRTKKRLQLTHCHLAESERGSVETTLASTPEFLHEVHRSEEENVPNSVGSRHLRRVFKLQTGIIRYLSEAAILKTPTKSHSIFTLHLFKTYYVALAIWGRQLKVLLKYQKVSLVR